MNNPLVRTLSRPLSRREFVGVASAGSAGAAVAAAAPIEAAPRSGDRRIRVGVIGCGGRGTGAALQAVDGHPDVVVTALGDLFADQIASAAELLQRRGDGQFDCPSDRRFVGADAWRRVIASGIDLVIVAAAPAERPLHVAAAVRAGLHVYCETPAAVDVAGVRMVADAAAEARRLGLSFQSGLCRRHDPAMQAAIRHLHAGAVGTPRHVAIRSSIGLPWHMPWKAAWSRAEWQTRNWIADRGLSGGSFVEHHVHALDAALWAMGDDVPAVAVPAASAGPVVAAEAESATAVVYHYADGRSIAASLDRRPLGDSRIEERVTGSAGSCDLRGSGMESAAPAGGAHAAAMQALVAGIRSGRRVDDADLLCRATLVAIMGRAAAESGHAVRLADLQPAAVRLA